LREELPVLEKVDHSEYLPNSLKKKQTTREIAKDGNLLSSSRRHRSKNYSMELRSMRKRQNNSLSQTDPIDFSDVYKPYQNL
jgi:hypothetical protein